MGSFFADISGMRFGEWKVIAQAFSDPSAGWYWICQCSCGAVEPVHGGALRRGGSTRCTECQRKRQIKDLTGMQFGEWTVLRQAPPVNRQTMWLCRCSCGTEKTVNGQTLKRTGRNASTRCRDCSYRARRKAA